MNQYRKHTLPLDSILEYFNKAIPETNPYTDNLVKEWVKYIAAGLEYLFKVVLLSTSIIVRLTDRFILNAVPYFIRFILKALF
jgi:hypothetical protein